MKEAKARLQSVRFMTVLADGSTDAVVVEQETVSVRYVYEGTPITELAETVPLDSGKAVDVYSAIKTGIKAIRGDFEMNSAPDNGPKVIGANFDGASVMMGIRSGVKALIQADHPQIIVIHCVAHKLELGVLDAVKAFPSLATFEQTIKDIYAYYHFSPKRRREVREMAEILDMVTVQYGTVKSVRWVASKTRALQAVQKNLVATAMHTEDQASGEGTSRDPKSMSKGRKINKEITTVRFVKMLHFMLDYLELITKTSRIFQQRALLLPEVPGVIQQTTMALTSLATLMGKNTREFYKGLNADKLTFQVGQSTLQLKGPSVASYTEDNDMKTLTKQTINYLETRFQVFSEPPLSYFKVFNFTFWPSGQNALAVYGAEEIQALADHYQSLLSEEERDNMPTEWVTLKQHVGHFRTSPMLQVYGDLLRSPPEELQNVLILVEMMLTLSPSTAECERQFSCMNRVKTSLRNSLSQDTLQALMKIGCDGPQDTDYSPDAAVDDWLTSGSKSRHLDGHKSASSVH